jgi:hypothetical protein
MVVRMVSLTSDISDLVSQACMKTAMQSKIKIPFLKSMFTDKIIT